MSGEHDRRLLAHAHELNRRIQENPTDKGRIIREFYSELVSTEDIDTAHLVLLLQKMIEAGDSKNGDKMIPAWFARAGFVVGGISLLFFMGLVLLSIAGHEVPAGSKFLVVVVLAMGAAFSAGVLGGEATARGKIPFLANQNPLTISTTGGIAVLLIMLIVGYYFYVK
jgi:hypothetical protein